jgi:amidophosphoribosyltransferase
MKEICEFIGADSLAYLSREGMYVFLNGQTGGFCDACFSGNYPLHFDDEGKSKQLHLFEAAEQR